MVGHAQFRKRADGAHPEGGRGERMLDMSRGTWSHPACHLEPNLKRGEGGVYPSRIVEVTESYKRQPYTDTEKRYACMPM